MRHLSLQESQFNNDPFRTFEAGILQMMQMHEVADPKLLSQRRIEDQICENRKCTTEELEKWGINLDA